MKVLVYKSYENRSENFYNYGDDCEVVFHNFRAFEKELEVSNDEFAVLNRAIAHFNSKKNSGYTLGVIVVAEEDEISSLISNFKNYEAAEIIRLEKESKTRLAKMEADKLKREANKKERSFKKLAKELNLSVDEVRAKLAAK